MKVVIVFVVAVIAATAQNPTARIGNTSRPASADFQVGDHFEVVLNGQAGQPVSVRTTTQDRTDFGPVIGWTDSSGRWSVTGQFEKADFGSSTEAWTIGEKLASPVLSFSVSAPCLSGGPGMAWSNGPNNAVSCLTGAGIATFATPSLGDPLRTPDGRVVTAGTPEATMGALIEDSGGHSGQHGDGAAVLITKVIGANILDDREIRNVISIIGAAFQNRNVVPPTVNPATMELLQHLMAQAQQDSLKQEISKTVAFIQSQ